MKKHFKKIASLTIALAVMASSLVFAVSASAASVSELKDKVISIALGEEGYRESGDNNTKYGEWYGYQGAWCTTFAIWCYDQADRAMGTKMYKNIVPSGGNCADMIDWFSGREQYKTRASGYIPQKGDWVFTRSSDNGSASHVSLVVSADSSYVYTIDGNVSNTVGQRKYSLSSARTLGFGIPDYSRYGSGSSGGSDSSSKPGNGQGNNVAYPPDTAVSPYAATVNRGPLNVRTGPSTSASKAGQIKEGSEVTVTAANGDWSKISNGYVKSEYLTPVTSSDKQPVSAESSGKASADTAGVPAAASVQEQSTAAPAVVVAEDLQLMVDDGAQSLVIGDVTVLHIEILPQGAQGTLVFSAGGDAVTVDEDGNVTAASEGESTVTVAVEGTEIAKTFTFNVTAPVTQEETTAKSVKAAAVSGNDTENDGKDGMNKKLAVTFIATGVSGMGIACISPSFFKKRRSKSVFPIQSKSGNGSEK